MSPIENRSITIRDERIMGIKCETIIGAGNEEDRGLVFEHLGNWTFLDLGCMYPNLIEEKPVAHKRSLARFCPKENFIRIDNQNRRHILGPAVFSLDGRSGKNQYGISKSKRRRLAFYPIEKIVGEWREFKDVEDR